MRVASMQASAMSYAIDFIALAAKAPKHKSPMRSVIGTCVAHQRLFLRAPKGF